jgi:hypothetical protein
MVHTSESREGIMGYLVECHFPKALSEPEEVGNDRKQ